MFCGNLLYKKLNLSHFMLKPILSRLWLYLRPPCHKYSSIIIHSFRRQSIALYVSAVATVRAGNFYAKYTQPHHKLSLLASCPRHSLLVALHAPIAPESASTPPIYYPLWPAMAKTALVLSIVFSLSISAAVLSIVYANRPIEVLILIPSMIETNSILLARNSAVNRWGVCVERPSRSCFQTMTVSPGRNNFIFLSSPGRFDFGVPLSVLQETGGWESIEMVTWHRTN